MPDVFISDPFVVISYMSLNLDLFFTSICGHNWTYYALDNLLLCDEFYVSYLPNFSSLSFFSTLLQNISNMMTRFPSFL
jgi:hypothetical protein